MEKRNMQVNHGGSQTMAKTMLTVVVVFAAAVGAAAALAQDDTAIVTADEATHVALLGGQYQVPPVETAGTGMAYIRYDADTNRIAWTVEYQDLTGPLTGAHIHGPATAEENAGVLIDLRIGGGSDGLLEGEADITAEQANQLAEGLLYVNVHTEANPGGEIRGQLLPPVAAEAAEAAAPEDDTPDPALVAALIDEGESIYRSRCAGCHGRDGEGQPPAQDAAPALAGRALLLSTRTVATQIFRGGDYMPAFDSLTDRQVAAVITYIRNSFGNDYGVATEEDVAEHR